jgi:hypothetical protein
MATSNSATSLFPPRDKRARKLWHELQQFKKLKANGSKKPELRLPPDTSYMRACAHHFAERLGMRSETLAEGESKAVVITVPGAAGAPDPTPGSYEEGVSASTSSEAGPDGRKRKLPDSGFDTSIAVPEPASAAPEMAANTNGHCSRGQETDALATPLDEEADEARRAKQRKKREIVKGLAKCIKSQDALTATAIFNEMQVCAHTPRARRR